MGILNFINGISDKKKINDAIIGSIWSCCILALSLTISSFFFNIGIKTFFFVSLSPIGIYIGLFLITILIMVIIGLLQILFRGIYLLIKKIIPWVN